MLSPDEFTMTKGDTPEVVWTLFDKHGNPADLTDTDVTIRLRRGDVVRTAEVAVYGAPTNGQVSYRFPGTDLPGRYVYKFRLVRDEEKTSAPTSGTGSFTIEGGIGEETP